MSLHLRALPSLPVPALRLARWLAVLAPLSALAPPTLASESDALDAVASSAAEVSAAAQTEDAIAFPLEGARGDVQRGRAVVADRRVGMCLLCHSGPIAEERTPGNLSSDLRGAGSRWSEGQLRLRIVDARRLNPDSIMPAYHRTEGLNRVGAPWQGRPLLTAQQVEDVVAYLLTLK